MQRRGKHTSITIEVLLGNGVFCLGRPDAIYNEDPRSAEIKLMECLETAVEND
jgi:hypothetical protein